MFNRKKIKALKENLKMVNDQRLQLRNENIIYQKELIFLRNLVKENNEMLKELTKKKKVKPKKEELAKAYKRVVKKNEQ